MSQAKTYAVGAGGTVQLSGGTALAVLSTSVGAVTVTAWKGGTAIAVFTGIQGGLAWRARDAAGNPTHFDLVEIYSASAQDVLAFTGDGDTTYTRSQGDVTVTNAPDIGTVTTLPDIGNEQIGASELGIFASASTALQTIVAPASNTAGIVLHSGVTLSKSVNATTNYARLMVKASAPSAWNDTAARTILFVTARSTGSYAEIGRLARKILIPAGLGLYAQSSDTNDWSVTGTYDVL